MLPWAYPVALGLLTAGTFYINFHLIAHNHNPVFLSKYFFFLTEKEIKTPLKVPSFLTPLPHSTQ